MSYFLFDQIAATAPGEAKSQSWWVVVDSRINWTATHSWVCSSRSQD